MISQVFDQVRLKETLSSALNFVQGPLLRNRKDLTNKRILSSLRKLGVATTSELKELEERIEKLESEIAALRK